MKVEELKVHEIPLKWALLILAALLVLACIPIWAVEYPPLVDYPMHVARAYLLSLPQDGQGITEFYRANWQLLPNLGMDILVSQMMHVVPPPVAGKLFLCLIQLGLLTGAFAFSVALLKRVTIAAFLPALALFDQWFWMGFANYLFGLGIALWAVAVWLWSEDWPRGQRLAVMALFAMALVVCHLMAFLIAAGVIFVLSLPRDRDWVKPVLVGTSGLCAVAYVALTMTGRTPINWTGRVQSLGNEFWLNQSGAGLIAIAFMFRSQLCNRMLPALAGLGVLTCLGPTFLGGTAFACDRLTLPLLLFFLAQLEPLPRHERIVAVLGAAALAVLMGIKLHSWQQSSDFASAVTRSLRVVPDRSTLATFVLGQRERPTWKYQRHVADWILVEKPVFVASNFAKRRQQPMTFQPDYEEWHQYQVNNPVGKDSWAEIEAEFPKLQALQRNLNRKRAEVGKPEAALYVLVLHEKPEQPDIVGRAPEFTLLRVEPGQ